MTMKLLALTFLCSAMLAADIEEDRWCGLALLNKIEQVCTSNEGKTDFKTGYMPTQKKFEYRPFGFEGNFMHSMGGIGAKCCTDKCPTTYLKTHYCD